MSGISTGGEGCCANCGVESSHAVKLKNCTACRLVKYCGVDCQRAHRKKHKGACKKRVAELKDEQLYSQGHARPEGDSCPICTLPIPLPTDKYSFFNVCCMKRVCQGCTVAAQSRGMHDCPFCRTPIEKDDGPALAQVQNRVVAKDPAAMFFLGDQYGDGKCGLERNVPRAIELWTEAAELGSTEAQFILGNKYNEGEGVTKDEAKAVQHWEKAAVQGHANSRTCLGVYEFNKGNYVRAVRHFLIAARIGDKESLDMIKAMSMKGYATKEQYADALKGYQESVQETKSPERDNAEAFLSWMDSRES